MAQPSQIKTRLFLFGGRAALAVRNKKVLAVRNYVPYVSEPPSRVKRNIRLTVEVGVCSAAPTTF